MEEISPSVVRLPVVKTLLTFATLGALWAIVGTLLVVISASVAAGDLRSALASSVVGVMVAALAGVPVGAVAGVGALLGHAVAARRIAAALGAGIATLAVTAVWWIVSGTDAVFGLAVIAVAVLAAALTPITLRWVGTDPESRSAWLLVAGVVAAAIAFIVVPSVVPGTAGSIIAILVAVCAAVLLVIGTWRTRGSRGAIVTVLVALVGVGLTIYVAVLLVANLLINS